VGDPDMMEVGNGMSVSEDRAHFSLWSMLAAPLIAGNDLRKMSKKNLGTSQKTLKAQLPAHDVLMLRLDKTDLTDLH
jgi:hypothetical protein